MFLLEKQGEFTTVIFMKLLFIVKFLVLFWKKTEFRINLTHFHERTCKSPIFGLVCLGGVPKQISIWFPFIAFKILPLADTILCALPSLPQISAELLVRDHAIGSTNFSKNLANMGAVGLGGVAW